MRLVPGGAGSRRPVVARIHRESELATMRDFNTAGPVRPDWHYCLPPLERFRGAAGDYRCVCVNMEPAQTARAFC